MIIVAGFLEVHPDDREQYLTGCTDVIRAARSTKGCIDFHLSADRLDPGRINVFEQWESVEAVEAFRGAGASDEQQAAILNASVMQHEVARTIALT